LKNVREDEEILASSSMYRIKRQQYVEASKHLKMYKTINGEKLKAVLDIRENEWKKIY